MLSRRKFLRSTATLGLVSLVAPKAWPTTLAVRPSWEHFRTSRSFPRFLQAIGAMRANSDSTDPASWAYWTLAHRMYCPHKKPYFLAWHRGLLKRFEGQLRKVAADPGLLLPYWDYYADPQLPAEFLDATSPLWRKGRQGDNVAASLTLDPFLPTVLRFARGQVDAFETTVETVPHNPVHDLIGGAMAQVLISASDPIFWVHHANIDRLWAAWTAAAGGRRMPMAVSPYWSGSFLYGPKVPPLLRSQTKTTAAMGYRYEDEQMPIALPVVEPVAQAAQAFATAPSLGTLAWGEGRSLALDERSLALTFRVKETEQARWRDLLSAPFATVAKPSQEPSLVLEGVRTTVLGELGGYVYVLYLHVEGGPFRAMDDHRIGTLGAFEVGVEKMRQMMGGQPGSSGAGPLRLSFPILPTLRKLGVIQLGDLRVTWIRLGGGKPQAGTTIEITSARVVADEGAKRGQGQPMAMAA